MRRGHSFETQLDKLAESINAAGYHMHKNHPCRTQDGTYLSGEPYDYDLFTPDYKAAFDAKECHADKWYFTDKEIRQANNLKKCKNAGFEAFFLIYFFTTKKLLAFDVDVFTAALCENRKYLSQAEGSAWNWKNS